MWNRVRVLFLDSELSHFGPVRRLARRRLFLSFLSFEPSLSLQTLDGRFLTKANWFSVAIQVPDFQSLQIKISLCNLTFVPSARMALATLARRFLRLHEPLCSAALALPEERHFCDHCHKLTPLQSVCARVNIDVHANRVVPISSSVRM